MKNILLLLSTLFISIPLFAFDTHPENSLEQFIGNYELVKCSGKRHSTNSEDYDPTAIEITYQSYNSLKLRFDYSNIGRDSKIVIENINDAKDKYTSRDEYGCINHTIRSTIRGNILTEHERFVSYPLCGKIPVFTGEKILKITDLGKGDFNFYFKDTIYQNLNCLYRKL